MEGTVSIPDVAEAYGQGWQYDPSSGTWWYLYGTYIPTSPRRRVIICPHCGKSVVTIEEIWDD